MTITNFTNSHILEASNLAISNYKEECKSTVDLPFIEAIPNLADFAENGLSVAALEDGKLSGFLCFYPPWENAFSSTNAKGTFSPVHAHGAITKNRENIYKYLYQAAAEKLVKMGVNSHAIALYAHDKQAINAFYTYGFGLRCIDAIRPMEQIDCLPCEAYLFCEISSIEKNKLLPLKNKLITHLGKSPAFMYYPRENEAGLEACHKRRNSRYFCAMKEDNVIAFLELMDCGENFACDDIAMKNICGAFCLPEHRGKGVFQNLLNFAIKILKTEGYTRLGVDFESLNPTAYGFWLKYFTAYTHSVVRRIDDKIFEVINNDK